MPQRDPGLFTGGVSTGGTEATNGVVEKTRRLAHGFRSFTNHRIRIPLAADHTRSIAAVHA